MSNQVYHISIRWSYKDDHEIKKEEFMDHTRLFDVLKRDADKFVFQIEDTTNNLHYQGYAKLKVKDRPATYAIKLNADFNGIEIRASSTAGTTALAKYCLKSDTRVAGPWADHKIYMGADLFTEATMRPWQRQLYQMLQQDPDDRTIIFIYEPLGNIGKTKFSKYMDYHHGTLCCGYANAADVLNLVYKYQNLPHYIFDLARTKPQNFSAYDTFYAIECIKNGQFNNTKYETGRVNMDPPHVVVFSNMPPDRKSLSIDRYRVFTVNSPNGNLEARA